MEKKLRGAKDPLDRIGLKLIQLVKIADLFLQSVSSLFHVIILSIYMKFYIWLSKNFWNATSKNGEIGHFYQSLLIESF